jgi:hypothetical protein
VTTPQRVRKSAGRKAPVKILKISKVRRVPPPPRTTMVQPKPAPAAKAEPVVSAVDAHAIRGALGLRTTPEQAIKSAAEMTAHIRKAAAPASPPASKPVRREGHSLVDLQSLCAWIGLDVLKTTLRQADIDVQEQLAPVATKPSDDLRLRAATTLANLTQSISIEDTAEFLTKLLAKVAKAEAVQHMPPVNTGGASPYLSPQLAQVWMAVHSLWSRAGRRSVSIDPAEIATMTGLSVGEVRASLSALEAQGQLRRDGNRAGSGYARYEPTI